MAFLKKTKVLFLPSIWKVNHTSLLVCGRKKAAERNKSVGGECLHHSWYKFYVCVIRSHKTRQGEQQEVGIPLNQSDIFHSLSFYSYHFRFSFGLALHLHICQLKVNTVCTDRHISKFLLYYKYYIHSTNVKYFFLRVWQLTVIELWLLGQGGNSLAQWLARLPCSPRVWSLKPA